MAYILLPGRFNTPPSGPVQLRRNSDILRGVQVATSPHGTGRRRLLDMLHGKTYQTVTGNGTKSATGSRGLGHVVGGNDYFSIPFDPEKFSSGKITAVTHVSITAASGQRGYLHIGTSDKFTPRLLLQQANAEFNSYWASAFRLVSSGFFSDLSARAGFTYSAGTAAVYKNGKLANSGSHPAIDFTGATELWVGGGYEYPTTNTIGEMLVWNRALSAAEHAALAREWYGLIYEQNPRRVYVDMGAVVFDATPSGATVQGITATGATPKATVTRSGPSPVGTLYYVIYADGLGAPSSAQVKAGQNATGAAAVASGNEACRTTTGDQVFGIPASGLSPSTAYRVAFVASDGTTDSAVAASAAWNTSTVYAVSIGEASHPSDSSNVSLSAAVALVVADSLHSHLAGELAVYAAQSIAVNDALHAEAAQSIALAAALNVIVADCLHNHIADDLALDSGTALSINAAQHSNLSASVSLSASLSIQAASAMHVTSAESAAISAVHGLAVDGSAHAHSAANVVIDSGLALTIADAFSSHAAEGLSLGAALSLAVNDALSAHVVDALLLSSIVGLAVNDAISTHGADNLTLSEGGLLPVVLANARLVAMTQCGSRPAMVQGAKRRRSL